MRRLRLNRRPIAYKISIVVVAIGVLAWSLIHVAFVAGKPPQYKLVPLSTNKSEYGKAVARFSNPSALDHIRIPVIAQSGESLLSDEVNRVKWLIVSKYWPRPHKIERIELVSSNELYVVVHALFGRANRTLFLKKENDAWIVFAGEAK